MRLLFSSKFKKHRKKLKKSLRNALDERLRLFEIDQFHHLLSNHALQGEYEGYRSINITGDYRAIFEQISPDAVIFIRIGTHAELYE